MSTLNAQYDAAAPHYRTIAAQRAEYLNAIDAHIVQRAPSTVRALCDVGAADGVRGLHLAEKLQAQRVFLCEPSREMLKFCHKNSAPQSSDRVTVWQGTAENIPLEAGPFDVIVCLWNVLGHMRDSKARIQALAHMAHLLTPGGRIFLDVNNRHNASAYGFWRVLYRRIADSVAFDERRGDAVYTLPLPCGTVQGMGHLFVPAELKHLCAAAQVKVVECFSVDYCTGKKSFSLWRGQLFMTLEVL